MEQEPKKKPLNKWLQLINIPIQMGVVIFVFSYFGQWLDEYFENSHKTNTKIFVMIGVFLGLYTVIRQVNKLNKEE